MWTFNVNIDNMIYNPWGLFINVDGPYGSDFYSRLELEGRTASRGKLCILKTMINNCQLLELTVYFIGIPEYIKYVINN